jgi:hypothetical protein
MRFPTRRTPAFLALALTVTAAGCGDADVPLGLAPLEPDLDAAILTGPRSGTARVGTFDGSGTEVQSYLGYPSGYAGGVSVAMGDVNGDGVDDVVIGASSGVARVRVIDGDRAIQGEVSGDAILADFIAFSTAYTGGVTVATGDVDDDGRADIIVGAATGLAHVRVVDGASAPADGEVGGDAILADFFAFPVTYTGGVNVASGDVNGDGRADVVVGAASGAAHVRVIEGRAAMAAEGVVDSGFLANFFAFPLTYAGGVNVAAGDVDGDGKADVVVGAATGTAHVRVVEAAAAQAATGVIEEAGLLANFFAFALTYTGGVTVASGDVTDDGRADLVTGAATGVAHVRVFDGAAPPTGVADDPADRVADFFAYPASYSGGVSVAAGR